MGRPSDFTPEIAAEICERLAAQNGSLAHICKADDMPGERTVYRWLEQHESFRQEYARARDRQADRFVGETMTIADDATDANLARLRVDVRKWAASKLAPKKYGERVTQEHVGKDDGPIQHAEVSALDILEARVASVSARIGEAAGNPKLH